MSFHIVFCKIERCLQNIYYNIIIANKYLKALHISVPKVKGKLNRNKKAFIGNHWNFSKR